MVYFGEYTSTFLYKYNNAQSRTKTLFVIWLDKQSAKIKVFGAGIKAIVAHPATILKNKCPNLIP
jgi:hypothetical protein